MSYIRALFGLLAAGSIMVDNPMPKRLVTKVVCAIAAVILSAVLAGALLLVGTVYAYQLMILSYNVAPLAALLYILALIAVLFFVAVIGTICAVRAVAKNITGLRKSVPMATHFGNEVTQAVQGFFNGLTGKSGL